MKRNVDRRIKLRSDILNFFVFYKHDEDTSKHGRHVNVNVRNYSSNVCKQLRLICDQGLMGIMYTREGWSRWWYRGLRH